jgi:capsular polysaccharide biosynthesis protein
MQSMVDQTNVSIVDRATVPRKHSSPKVMVNLTIGVLGGLLLGIGAAVFMDVFVRKVHSREDLMGELGVPLLGHLKKV